MNIIQNKPPRTFTVKGIEIKDHGKVRLGDDEMVSFVTPTQKEYDFTAKSWGFYASPSLNGRLKNEGFKSALVKNDQGMVYLMTVDISKMELFNKYIQDENQEVIEWLDERISS